MVSDNQMKASRNKFHLLVSGKNQVIVNVNGLETENTECEGLLVIKADCELKFS